MRLGAHDYRWRRVREDRSETRAKRRERFRAPPPTSDISSKVRISPIPPATETTDEDDPGIPIPSACVHPCNRTRTIRARLRGCVVQRSPDEHPVSLVLDSKVWGRVIGYDECSDTDRTLVPGTKLKKRYVAFGKVEETADMHLDFLIDGKLLRTWIQEWEGAGRPPEEVSLLTLAKSKLALEQIDRLLGRPPHQYHHATGYDSHMAIPHCDTGSRRSIQSAL